MRHAAIITLSLLLIHCSRQPDEGGEQAGDPGIRVVREYYQDGSLKSEIQAKGNLRHGITRNYSEGGLLVSTINYQNNKKHGETITYYTDGNISSVIRFENGLRQGEAVKYYKDGSVYMITPYQGSLINGVQKTFLEDGTLQSEMPYKNGQEGVGLREYTRSGELKKMDSEIRIREINEISMSNKLILKISLSDGSKNVAFFRGELTEGKYWNNSLSGIPAENGVATLEFYVSRGSFVMETINIVARIETSLNNHYILQTKYHLAAENKLSP